MGSGKMYEEDKRSRENSRNRDRNAPPVGRPNYYQVSTTTIWSYIATLDIEIKHDFEYQICLQFTL